MGTHVEAGIIPEWKRELRTFKALEARGLIRRVSVPKFPRNGYVLTALGAETLVPPGTATYPDE